jgi:hypothetical protein
MVEIILRLEEREAEALMALLGSISGAEKGPRGSMVRIWEALRNAGVRGSGQDYFVGGLSNNISEYVAEWPKDAVKYPKIKVTRK